MQPSALLLSQSRQSGGPLIGGEQPRGHIESVLHWLALEFQTADRALNPVEDRDRALGRTYMWINRFGKLGARLDDMAHAGQVTL